MSPLDRHVVVPVVQPVLAVMAVYIAAPIVVFILATVQLTGENVGKIEVQTGISH